VITTTQFVQNSNEDILKLKTLCQVIDCASEIQIATHKFNSKTVYREQRTSTQVTSTWACIMHACTCLCYTRKISTSMHARIRSCYIRNINMSMHAWICPTLWDWRRIRLLLIRMPAPRLTTDCQNKSCNVNALHHPTTHCSTCIQIVTQDCDEFWLCTCWEYCRPLGTRYFMTEIEFLIKGTEYKSTHALQHVTTHCNILQFQVLHVHTAHRDLSISSKGTEYTIKRNRVFHEAKKVFYQGN